MSKSFTINIINDNITECDETFKLILSIPAAPCEVVIGNTDTTEVTIKDNGRILLVTTLCCINTDQQGKCCHLINHDILLKRTLLHYQLV